jgi:hypothetical protein
MSPQIYVELLEVVKLLAGQRVGFQEPRPDNGTCTIIYCWLL